MSKVFDFLANFPFKGRPGLNAILQVFALYVIVFVLMFIAAGPAHAQRCASWLPAKRAAVAANVCPCGCPDAVCVCPNCPMAYRWVAGKERPNEHYLYAGKTQIGGYDADRGIFLRYDAKRDKWAGEPTQPPIAPPATERTRQRIKKEPIRERKTSVEQVAPPTPEPEQNYGIDLEKLDRFEPRYSSGAGEITRETAYAMVGGDIPDQSKLLRVTVIGPNADRKPLAASLAAPPPDLAGTYVLNDFAPTAWQVKDAGFRLTGNPVVVYCQDAAGKVLHRQDDLDGGPGQIFSAIRRARPNYDPAKDPDLRKPPVTPAPDAPANLPSAALVGGGLLAGAVVVRLLGQLK